MADTSYTQNQVMFKLLNLFITNAVITSCKIAYPKGNTMEKTLVVKVCSVYFGDTIITSRLVREDDFRWRLSWRIFHTLKPRVAQTFESSIY